MSTKEQTDKEQRFVYLLNALEDAAQSVNPHGAGYGEKRKAVLEYVAQLESRTTPSATRESVLDEAAKVCAEMSLAWHGKDTARANAAWECKRAILGLKQTPYVPGSST